MFQNCVEATRHGVMPRSLCLLDRSERAKLHMEKLVMLCSIDTSAQSMLP